MAGHDAKDTTCADLPVPDYEKAVGVRSKAYASVFRRNTASAACMPTRKLWEQGRLACSGRRAGQWRCRTRNTPAAHRSRRLSISRYDGVVTDACCGYDITEMYEKTRSEGFGEEVRQRIMIGTHVLSAVITTFILRAQYAR